MRIERPFDFENAGGRPSPAPSNVFDDEDVLATMARWQSEGQRVALVTLVSVEGGAPRQPGCQMAVASDGRYAGYLSGGCLEKAVVLEAQAVLAEGRNRLVRYGKDSRYLDIRLPCGSGLDLYFDQAIDIGLMRRMRALQMRRRPFALETSLVGGSSVVREWNEREPIPECSRNAEIFRRIYAPKVRLALFGEGPMLVALAQLGASMGVELVIATEDAGTRGQLADTGLEAFIEEARPQRHIARLDFASAIVLCFHAHEKEPQLIADLLRTPAFYIGAVGNHAVQRHRLETLASQGVERRELSRIRGPIGVIAGAKSKATLAVGVLAEVMAQAKLCNLVV